jgi:tRNA A-37 threonylcarbamoyl transferase component Bud32
MSQEARCSECGSPLEGDSPSGQCPRCLLKRGLEANTIEYTAGRDESARWMPPAPEELAARFPELDILELIGRGGMGAVYKARQTKLHRVVALKILPPEIGRDPAFADRFAHEAQAMARLSHPHIVAIYDFGDRQGLYFFLMEYVDGLNLRQLLDSGNVAPKEALAIVPQICEALQFAHDKGIVHRDIKPENILLDRSGQVKIADFGLAKLVCTAEATGGLSASEPAERVCGTPQYMAPEQVERPAEVDHRADIYSLGVVFYQMLTGELPRGRFEPPSHKVLIDVRLDEVVLKAMEKEPARRYQQASQLKTDVEAVSIPIGALGSPPSDSSALVPKKKRPLSTRDLLSITWVAVVLCVIVFVVSGLAERGMGLGLLLFGLGAFAGMGAWTCVRRAQYPEAALTRYRERTGEDPMRGVVNRDRFIARLKLQNLISAGLLTVVAVGLCGAAILVMVVSATAAKSQQTPSSTKIGRPVVTPTPWTLPATKSPAPAPEALAAEEEAAEELRKLGMDIHHAMEVPAGEREPDTGPVLRAIVITGYEYNKMLSDDNLRYVAALRKLQVLDISAKGVTDAGIPQIAGLTELTSLALGTGQVPDLTVGTAKITDKCLPTMAKLTSLKSLTIRGAITDDGLAALKTLTHLETLDLNSAAMTGEGLKHLKTATHLKSLTLGDNWTITDAALAQVKDFTELETLDTQCSKITDAGLVHLKDMKSLQHLSLSRAAKITEAGLDNLLGLTNLKTLDIYGVHVSADYRKKLGAALPKCFIIYDHPEFHETNH